MNCSRNQIYKSWILALTLSKLYSLVTMQRKSIIRLFHGAAVALLLLYLAHVSIANYDKHVRWKYTFSCFGLWPENTLSLNRRTPRTTPITVILAATANDDQNQLRKESGLRPGDSQIVYVVDDPTAAHTTPLNKGNEAMVYLTYLIDHYDSLPEIMVFMHAHRQSWHNDDLLARSSALMVNKLQPDYVLRRGYANLACESRLQKRISATPSAPGLSVLSFTREDWVLPVMVTDELPQKQPAEALHEQYLRLWDELFPSSPDPAPTAVATAKGGQFAVTRDAVLSVPRDRLRHLRDWIVRTDLPSKSAGAVFEVLWHVVFLGPGNSSLSVTPPQCYCGLYGLCMRDQLSDQVAQRVLDGAAIMAGRMLRGLESYPHNRG
ncbi:hypothetical protein F4779DRAFT_102892 [Xylariaceae sp. FL0662B]|nr:hypothetical protein F4779DRAFT_102892 [Xylariaceae sp. FL0662B]